MKRKNINTKEKIKNYFLINPTTKLRVRQIERALKLSLPSVIRYCKELKKQGILKTIKIGNVVFYLADRANENFLLEKKLFNIKQLYKCGILNYLKKQFHNPVIIVFGSYAKSEDVEDSDIDLYVETSSNKTIDIKDFENLLKRKIQIFRYKNIKKVSNPYLANNIINGIVLNGFLEVFK
ncbi:hypothetical protein GF374_02690 [Candidatus Woesearchaeota archaeon]|nr:hypothetical protein [Candidatus Woesearchaeota archaeon]